uniref:hypothetical protein n=1 Tax=Bacillus sp. CGMCC 1.16541 TaxID=2185143 RepID=UPI0013A565E1
MIEAITIEAFAKLLPDNREAYVLERAQLEDFWLIGRVRNPFEEKPFFFIEQLINPYTGVVLESQIFSDFSRPQSIFCRTVNNDSNFPNFNEMKFPIM